MVGTAGAATSPAALREAILRAVSAEHSVRYVTVSSSSGVRLTMVCDVDTGRGIQRVTLTKSGSTGHVTTLVLGSNAYIRGDAFGLRTYMRFPASIASRYAGRWISVPPSSPLHAPVAVDATYGSFISHALPEGNLSLVSGTVGGRRVVGLRGKAPEGGTLILYVRASGSRLPLEGKEVARSATGLVTMSRWNESVRLPKPAHAILITSLH